MSNLHEELAAAGFRPVAVPFDGAVAWTAWLPPEPPMSVYERYYELVKQAMLAQADNPVWKLINDRWTRRADHSEGIQNTLAREYIAVVSCWRSASLVPPADDDCAANCANA